MRITHDSKADAIYIDLYPDAQADHTREVEDGVLLEYDASGRVIGLEILSWSARVEELGEGKIMTLDDLAATLKV